MKTFLLLFTVLFSLTASANNYYFSQSNGNDSRTSTEAQNPLTPWKSLEQLNRFSSSLKPGDSVLLKCNEVFVGQIIIQASGQPGKPIVYASYGTGNKPVISGLTTLANWVYTTNGVWKATNAAAQEHVNVLLINDSLRAMGRYPNLGTTNNGYLTVQGHNGNTEIMDDNLASMTNWTGGEVVIRKNRWIIDKYQIAQHSGNSIKFQVSGYNYEPNNDFGYFIQNHTGTLDLYGEWAYKSTEKAVYVNFGTEDPSRKTVQVSTVDTLLRIYYQSYLSFYNLQFKGSNAHAIDMNWAQGVSINNCVISYSGINAINAGNIYGFAVSNSQILNSYNNAIVANASYNSSIRENIIKNTGTFRGMGQNNDDTYQAVIMRGTSDTVEYNQIDSTGYMPIRFEGDSILIKNNSINYFALVKDDGGGIYTWQAGDDTTSHYARKIIGNIVSNGTGDGSGTNSLTYLPANGIYVDGHAGRVEITNNTVSDCSLGGIFLNNPSDIIISGNTVFNTKFQMNMSHIFDSYVGRNRLKNNIFFSKYDSQNILNLESQYDDIKNFAAFDSNFYCRPTDNNVIIQSTSKQGNKYLLDVYNLSKWQTIQQKDSGTKPSPLSTSTYTNISSYGDNKIANGNFENNISGLYAWSPEGYCTAAWKNTDKLDNGALEVSFNHMSPTSNEAYVVVGIGEVKAGQSYVVKLSTLGADNNQHIGIFLRQSQGPYGTISDIKYILSKSQRQDGEWVLTSTIDEKDASLVLSVEEASSAVYFDNVSVKAANVAVNNIDSKIVFLKNPSKFSKTMQINGTYVDAKNKFYSGTVTLEAYSSAVLIQQTASILPAESINLTGTKMAHSTKLTWTIDKSMTADHFEVTKSQDGINFSTFGQVSGSAAGTTVFQYTDENPFAGMNYYRVKLVSKEGKILNSSIIKIEFEQQITMKLSPNPANNVVRIALDASNQLKADRDVVIHSLNGVIVKKIHLPAQDMSLEVNLSNVPSGIYFVNLFTNNKLQEQKQLIKL